MKFNGKVGYVITRESSPGIFEEEVIERKMRGDFIRLLNRVESTDTNKINNDFTLSNSISLVADKFSYENFMWIRYVVYMGAKWEVNSVNILRPRLNIEMSGVWNG